MWFCVVASLFAFLRKVFTESQQHGQGSKCLHEILPSDLFQGSPLPTHPIPQLTGADPETDSESLKLFLFTLQ